MLLVNRESGAPRSDLLDRVLIVRRVITTPKKVSECIVSEGSKSCLLLTFAFFRCHDYFEQVKTLLSAASRAKLELEESLLGSRVPPTVRTARQGLGAT